MEYVFGIVLPPFIDYVNKDVKSEKEKTVVTIATCLVIACVLDWHLISTGTVWDAGHVFILAGVILAEAVTVYKLYWKDSRLRGILPGNGVDGQQG